MGMKMVLPKTLCLLVLFALIASSCGGGKQALIGSWVDPKLGIEAYQFRADGTCAELGVIQGTYAVSGNKLTITRLGVGTTYTYRIRGKSLTISSAGTTVTLTRKT